MTKELLDYFNNDELAASTWMNKYAKRNEFGDLIEQTPVDMHKRLAKEFARIEKHYDENTLPFTEQPFSKHYNKRKQLTFDRIFELFDKFKYIIPAGSVMSGLGSEKPVSLSNCFVLSKPSDSYTSIMMERLWLVELMKRRGGAGTDISDLRPRGAKVNNAAVTSTGAASFMDVFSDVTNEVAQQGRRGALMLSMHINHPDIVEFIEKKQDLSKVTGANVSVQITDEFMEAVENNETYILRWPIDAQIIYSNTFKLNNTTNLFELPYDTLLPMAYEAKQGNKAELRQGYMKKVRARDIWDKIIHCAWNTAEPGVLYLDKHLNYSPDGCYDKYHGVSTNPCLTGDTIIKTDIGDITIRDLIEKLNNNEIIHVLSYDITNDKLEYQRVNDGTLTRKNTNIIEIETEEGDKVKLTPDHKVYTENRGYVNASQLTKEDIILKIC